jgi:hypothetical protein
MVSPLGAVAVVQEVARQVDVLTLRHLVVVRAGAAERRGDEERTGRHQDHAQRDQEADVEAAGTALIVGRHELVAAAPHRLDHDRLRRVALDLGAKSVDV